MPAAARRAGAGAALAARPEPGERVPAYVRGPTHASYNWLLTISKNQSILETYNLPILFILPTVGPKQPVPVLHAQRCRTVLISATSPLNKRTALSPVCEKVLRKDCACPIACHCICGSVVQPLHLHLSQASCVIPYKRLSKKRVDGGTSAWLCYAQVLPLDVRIHSQ